MFCAQKGKVNLNGREITLLMAPMSGFYNIDANEKNPGKTQLRVAYVDVPEQMKLVPELFAKLLKEYLAK